MPDLQRRSLASTPLDGSGLPELPDRILLFRPGTNDSTHGPVLFDEESGRLVMAEFAKHGVDLMIDLEHLSTDPRHPNYDPDSRAWAKLELDSTGALWAVNVRWTPDGARRLAEKTQRYVSPAFVVDQETNRVVSLYNVAITALPATYGAPQLVAANGVQRMSLTLEEVQKIAEALDLPPDAPLDDLLAKIGALKAEPDAESDAEEPAAGDEPAAPAEDEEDAKMAMRSIAKFVGTTSPSAALAEVAKWRSAYLVQEEAAERVKNERAALERTERRGLVIDLVKLGAETPATAWSDDAGKVPCNRLSAEAIDELRDRVSKLKAAKPELRSAFAPKPAAGADAELSEREVRMCSENKIDLKDYAARKAARKAVVN